MKARLKVQEAQQVARGAATSPVVTLLARLGYAIKGVVYVVIGLLAILLVTGRGGSATDQNGALKAIYGSPLGEGPGRLLLIIITAGLFGFALWSLIQALFDTEQKGHKAKGIVARVGYAGVAVSYGLLGVAAYQIASTGSPSSKNSTSSAQNWTGLLLKQPAGVVLVILVGCIVLGIAAYLFLRAYRASFAKYLRLSPLNAQARKVVILLGRLGNTALGIVFIIVGLFLIIAALQQNPKDAKGLDAALVEILHQPFGPWLLGIVALGMIAYGLYSFVEARYRRVGNA
ncbi:MAG TPA: DUF1206 domain-containing protein [Ktedonobacteraceae bacterium]|nr:DUF1206 domain-containing protein [Ktedonobacteraceae bacterium]